MVKDTKTVDQIVDAANPLKGLAEARKAAEKAGGQKEPAAGAFVEP